MRCCPLGSWSQPAAGSGTTPFCWRSPGAWLPALTSQAEVDVVWEPGGNTAQALVRHVWGVQ